MDEPVLVETRRGWHAVGELVIAGPQYRAHGTIRLRTTAGGFAGVALPLAVVGPELVWPTGSAALSGRSCRELAESAGVEPGRADDLYHDGCDLGLDDPLAVDASAAHLIALWLAAGDAALRSFAPSTQPVLWPEHFDLAISVGEVNYGVSPGDSFHATPYAYVGPWTVPTETDGSFWNAPFGAIRRAEELSDAAAIAAFFAEGRRRAAR